MSLRLLPFFTATPTPLHHSMNKTLSTSARTRVKTKKKKKKRADKVGENSDLIELSGVRKQLRRQTPKGEQLVGEKERKNKKGAFRWICRTQRALLRLFYFTLGPSCWVCPSHQQDDGRRDASSSFAPFFSTFKGSVINRPIMCQDFFVFFLHRRHRQE